MSAWDQAIEMCRDYRSMSWKLFTMKHGRSFTDIEMVEEMATAIEIAAERIRNVEAELEQQRTRAEAAEQELRELRIQIGQHPATKAWAESSIGAITALQDKLAAVRSHLAGVEWEALEGAVKSHEAQGVAWTPLLNYGALKLIAAAREALEP